jgi:hypothetical protein
MYYVSRSTLEKQVDLTVFCIVADHRTRLPLSYSATNAVSRPYAEGVTFQFFLVLRNSVNALCAMNSLKLSSGLSWIFKLTGLKISPMDSM